jgi:dTMP kinase
MGGNLLMDFKFKGIYDNYIGVEGIDGSGKTTFIENINKNINKISYKKLFFNSIIETKRLPQNDNIYNDKIRKLLKTENKTMDEKKELFDLFLKDMDDFENKYIIDYDNNSLPYNKKYIVDRSLISTIIYQGYELGLDYIYGNIINRKIPKTIIYLDCKPEIAIERINNRNNEKEGYEKINILKELYDKYNDLLKIIRKNNNINIIYINANIESERVFNTFINLLD